MQKLKKTRRIHLKKTGRNRKTKYISKLEGKHKKNRNTWFPAHEPPRINRTNYSRRFVGWKSCIYICSVFLRVVLCFFCFFLLFFLFSPSRFKLLHLQSKKHIKTKKQKNSKENINKKNRNNKNLPARPLEIFIFRGGSWAGNPVFLFCLFSFEFFCCCFCFFLFVLFSPSLFKLLHLQSTKHIYKQKNRKTRRKT